MRRASEQLAHFIILLFSTYVIMHAVIFSSGRVRVNNSVISVMKDCNVPVRLSFACLWDVFRTHELRHHVYCLVKLSAGFFTLSSIGCEGVCPRLYSWMFSPAMNRSHEMLSHCFVSLKRANTCT